MPTKKKKQPVKQTARAIPGAQKLVMNQIIIRPQTRQKSDIGDWRNGLQAADMGRTKKLFDLIEDLLIDGVLSDAVDKRISAVTNSELTFQDADGTEVPEISQLMDAPAWEELLTAIMQVRFWGRAGIEFDFSTGFDARPIPLKHINLERHQILLNEYDDSGIPYEGDDHLLVLGKPRDFGLLLKAAPFAIYKRGAYGDYAQWLEIFGMPQRVGKYSSYDPESRKLLEEAFERSGSAPWLVIPKESDVETTAVTGKGGGTSPYDEFRKACNEEMLITILGQTMTTVQGDKGARSLGEVHKEVEEGKNRADMRFVQRVLNHFVLPMLEKRGFPVAGGKFIFPKAAEVLSVTDMVQLAGIMDIPVSYLHDKYSIPVPTGGEAVAGANKAAAPGADNPANPDDPKPDDPLPDKIEKVKSKNIKNSDEGFFRRMQDFFVNAPAVMTGAIRTLFLSDSGNNVSQLIDVSTLFNRAVKDIYRHKGSTGNGAGINEHLFAITDNVLQQAVGKTFGSAGAEWNRTNSGFVNQFKENTAVFSAFKNHQQTDEIVKQLYREDGSIRSFSEFKKEALKISEGYNKKYLQTEYNTAVRAARMAVNWKKFQETRHLYPNLEYMPSRAANPRDSHKEYWNKVWAMDDPIWNSIMPPSDWNCLCGVRAVDTPVTVLPYDWNPPATDPVFRNNPGVSASIVNTEATDYYKGVPERLRTGVEQFARSVVETRHALSLPERYVGKSGGYVDIVKQNPNEATKNIATYKTLADNGGKYTLLEPTSTGKSPDALNELTGMFSDAKHPHTNNGKNAMQNSIKDASKQKVGEVVINLAESYTSNEIFAGLLTAFQGNRAQTIETVILVREGKKPLSFKVANIREYLKKRMATKK